MCYGSSRSMHAPWTTQDSPSHRQVAFMLMVKRCSCSSFLPVSPYFSSKHRNDHLLGSSPNPQSIPTNNIGNTRLPTIHPHQRHQAISLLVDLMEELCIGASHAGDVVPDLFACAFDAFKDMPVSATTPSGTGAAALTAAESAADDMASIAAKKAPRGDRAKVLEMIPVFRRLTDTPLASVEGLQSAFGGVDALARFMLPE